MKFSLFCLSFDYKRETNTFAFIFLKYENIGKEETAKNNSYTHTITN